MSADMIVLIIQFALLGVIIYFFMIRPESKRRKAVASMQSSLNKGDRVVTIGGVHGRIHALEETTVTLMMKVQNGLLNVVPLHVKLSSN